MRDREDHIPQLYYMSKEQLIDEVRFWRKAALSIGFTALAAFAGLLVLP